MAYDLQAALDKYLSESEKDYTKQRQYYADAQAQERAALDAQQAESAAGLQRTRDEALRQAYITRRTGERDMGGLLAAQGLSGGMSETAASSLLRNYQNTRNGANNQYSNDKTTLDTGYNTNVATLGSKYAQILADLEQRRRDDALKKAQFDYQAQQAEEQLRLQREQMEWERQQAAQAAAAAAAAAARPSGGSGRGSGGSPTSSRPTNITTPDGSRLYVMGKTYTPGEVGDKLASGEFYERTNPGGSRTIYPRGYKPN